MSSAGHPEIKESAPRFAWLRGLLKKRLNYSGLAMQRHAWSILTRVFFLTAFLQFLPAIASLFGVMTCPPGLWGYLWPALLSAHSGWFMFWLGKNKDELLSEADWRRRINVVKAWQLGLGLLWCIPAFWLAQHLSVQARTEHFMTVLVFCLVMGVFSFPVRYGYVRVACPPVAAHLVASLLSPLARTQITVILVVAIVGMVLLARTLRAQLLRYLGAAQESKRLLQALGEEHEENQAARSEAEATLGSVADGVVSSNPQLEISYINPQGAEMLGQLAESLMGKSLLDVMPFLRRAEGIWVRAEEGLSDEDEVDAKYSEQQGVIMVERNGRHLRRNFGFSANLISEGRQAGGLVVAFRDITERIAMQRELELRATTDQLTGILNRDGFGSRLRDVLDRVSVGAGSYALCYVDLDQIKVVNDSCGHPEGDRLLQQAAMLLERNMAEGEFAARIGGDEFAFLLSAKESSDLIAKAREIVQKIGQMGFVSGDKSFRIGASVGFVALTRDHKDVDTAFKQADIACYVAKNSGGRQLYEYAQDAEFARNYEAQLDWLGRLEDALENDRFRLYGQEICAIGDEHKHLEVLLS
ncbi:MAG: diguanylate cyclase, partial [Gammaproteobacteria bacterium]|nr:diguanylate cyclase [Gammaproteobacteria bacterium]